MCYTTMLKRAICASAALGLLAVGLATPAMAQPERVPPPNPLDPQDRAAPAAANAGVEPLVRGPIHEAFGQPQTRNPGKGLVVVKKPPAPVNEIPPDRKPAGDNVAWISGYWSWDPDSQDFIWVSGFWRDVPPGRQWIPGYWTEADTGYRWVSGYWAPAAEQEITYLPPPPDSLEVGPSTEPPVADYVWSPGYWQWSTSQYYWRPGFWLSPQVDWCWIPPTYTWTPRGCVFVDGYWDYDFANRGLLYCPVRFGGGAFLQPDYCFTPSICLDTGLALDFLFCWPRYHHYCFGDFYGQSWSGYGIYPWCTFGRGRFGWDPLFAFNRSRHWQDPQWSQRLAANLSFRQEHPEARPPLTFAAQQRLSAGGKLGTTRQWALGKSTAELAAAHTGLQLERLSGQHQQAAIERAHELNRFRSGRIALETRSTGVLSSRGNGSPVNVKLPATSPIARPRAIAGSGKPSTGERIAPVRETVQRNVLTPQQSPRPESLRRQSVNRETLRSDAIGHEPTSGPSIRRAGPQTEPRAIQPERRNIMTSRPSASEPLKRSSLQSMPPAHSPIHRTPAQSAMHGYSAGSSHGASFGQRSGPAISRSGNAPVAQRHVTVQHGGNAVQSHSRPPATGGSHPSRPAAPARGNSHRK